MKEPHNPQHQDSLQSAGTLFRTMLEASTDGVGIMNGNFQLVECNLSFATMLGYHRKELLGKFAWDWDNDLDEEQIRSRFGGREDLKDIFVTRHRRKNGSVYSVEISAATAKIGEEVMIVAICRDITSRMEEQLQLHKASFAMQHAPDACFWIDGEGRIVYANQAACRSLGYSVEELLKLTVFDIDPDYTQESFAKHRKLLSSIGSGLIESRHKTKDGRIFPVELSTNFFGAHLGNLNCTFSRDISQRKRTEKALRENNELLEQRVEERTAQLQEEVAKRKASEELLKESEARFKALAESSPDLISRYDRNHKHLYVNPVIKQFVGLEPSEVLGKSFKELRMESVLADFVSASLDHVFSSAAPHQVEFRLPNGLWVEALLTPELDEYGKVTAVIGTSRNITNRKRTEEELRIFGHLQALLMELATSFINLPLDRVDEAVWEALEKIGSYVHADRAYVYRCSPDQQRCRADYEWSGSKASPRLQAISPLALAQLNQKVMQLRTGEVFHLPEVSSLPTDDPLRDGLESSGVRSMIAVPMDCGQRIGGFLAFESVSRPHFYTDKEQQLLILFAQMMLNVSQRLDADRALSQNYDFQEIISSIATDFVAIRVENVCSRIEASLRQVGSFLGVERAMVGLFTSQSPIGGQIIEWCSEGIKPKKNILNPHPIIALPPELQLRMLAKKTVYHFPSIDKIEDDKPYSRLWKDTFTNLGIRSAVFLPIHTEERIFGLLGLETFTRNTHWTEYQINGLKVIAQILASAFTAIEARQELLQAKSQLEARVRERTSELEQQIKEKEEAMMELATAHSSLVEASRLAGMAEVATNVLHNVGNVLNSINVSCSMIRDNLQYSKVSSVARLSALVQEQRETLPSFIQNDPRGNKIPDYLSSLSETLVQERETMLNEANLLSVRIDHIKEIVAMQQSYGRVYGVREVIEPERMLEDAVTLNSGALTRHGIYVDRQYENVPAILVDRHKVLQILLNLITNAKYGCDEVDRKDKTITLKLFRYNETHIRIEVIDNGVGISQENQRNIFRHGFTTRKSGHGFGLHGGVIAARQLGGRLSFYSEGLGCGTTFFLELPIGTGE